MNGKLESHPILEGTPVTSIIRVRRYWWYTKTKLINNDVFQELAEKHKLKKQSRFYALSFKVGKNVILISTLSCLHPRE